MIIRFLFFILISAAVIYFCVSWIPKWLNSIGQKVKREEAKKFEEFDKKLNPPVKSGFTDYNLDNNKKTKKKAKRKVRKVK